jgi:uncharacterized OsmC-like protein
MSNKTLVTEDKIVNGVNVTRLTETIQAIQGQANLAEFQFRAKNKWQTGGHNRTRIDGFYGAGEEHTRDQPFEIEADEPPVLLGEDKAANPVEILLAALSGCLTTTLAYHAAANGIEIEGIDSEYEGDINAKGFLNLDANARKGFKQIRVNFKVKSDADKEKLAELAKFSPVFDTITNPTSVKLTVETV